MRTYRSSWVLSYMGLMCWAGGCASQTDHDALARANLQMQDKLSTAQAEQLAARTQAAMLRQDVLQARQQQQEVQDRLDGMGRQIDALRSKIDVQAEVISHFQKDAPQTQVAVSVSPDTLDKLIQRVQALTEQNSDLQARNKQLQSQIKIQTAAQEVAALKAQGARASLRNNADKPVPGAGRVQATGNLISAGTQPAH